MRTTALSKDKLALLVGKPPQELDDQVKFIVAGCLTTIETKLGLEEPLPFPVIKYDLKGATAGYAWIKDDVPTIQINLELLLQPEAQSDMLRVTIPHEVAHIAQFIVYPRSKPHGREWQWLMFLLGLPPKVCHALETKPARVTKRPHIYACLCSEHPMTNLLHNKMQSGQQRRYCKRCRGYLQFVRSED